MFFVGPKHFIRGKLLKRVNLTYIFLIVFLKIIGSKCIIITTYCLYHCERNFESATRRDNGENTNRFGYIRISFG